mgnify:CR=1 FL=1
MHRLDRHPTPCKPCDRAGRLREGSLANDLANFMDVDVVGQAVAGKQDRIPWIQPDPGAHVDAHVRRADKIRHEVAFFVMQCGALV